jgi:hypothetical protein
VSTTVQTRGIQRLQRLARLQALTLAEAEAAYKQASEQRAEVELGIERVEAHLAQAQQAMRAATQNSVATLQLMSEACDIRLVRLAALAQDKQQADSQVDQARATLLTERHRDDVLDKVLETRRAASVRQQAWQAEQNINDLWLAGRQWT